MVRKRRIHYTETDKAVMVAAEQSQVVHRGLPAIGPVTDMVGIDEAGAGAAGKAASTITPL